VQQRFDADPNDPLFRLVDGATCPSDNVSTAGRRKEAGESPACSVKPSMRRWAMHRRARPRLMTRCSGS
jgi:hypothetical protein